MPVLTKPLSFANMLCAPSLLVLQAYTETQAATSSTYTPPAGFNNNAVPVASPVCTSGPIGYTPQQPQQGYPPQNTGGYPPQAAQGYPPQQPQGYPPQAAQGYPPQQPQGYPPQNTVIIPPQGYTPV